MAARTIDWGRTVGGLLEKLYGGWQEAKTRKLGMLRGGLGELQKVTEMYGPGYMAGQERLALTGAKSALAARGLGGTTRPQGVSAGMKAGFEDVRRAGRAGAMTNIAQYMAGWQEDEAAPGTLAHLATGGFGGMIAERGMQLQETRATTQEGAEAGIGGGTFGGGAVGGTARMPSGGISTPGSPYGGYGGAGTTAQAVGVGAGGEFGPPTSYYGAGGGWQDWETTGGKTMAGVTAGQAGGRMSDAELAKKYSIDVKKLNTTVNVGGTIMSFRDYLAGGGSHAAFGIKPGSTGQFGGGAGGKSGGISVGGSW